VVCYDTAFHRDMPQVAQLLPIPRRYLRRGIRRYGFHGLSYTYLLEELQRLGDPAAGTGRVILAHLGSGASMAAVKAGRCIDTSMGFTPAAGFMMSTRSGDLDPGLMGYLARHEHLSSAKLQRLVNHESGLLGVSGISGDVRDLLACEGKDFRAEAALELFCYQARKWLAGFAAALGGLDTLVFSGGIGENAAPIRARICQDLAFLGIELDEERNAQHAPLISRGTAPVRVRVIPTDEEIVIARTTQEVLQLNRK
jgi:acetate kinase